MCLYRALRSTFGCRPVIDPPIVLPNVSLLPSNRVQLFATQDALKTSGREIMRYLRITMTEQTITSAA
jgi:hypothetical protein